MTKVREEFVEMLSECSKLTGIRSSVLMLALVMEERLKHSDVFNGDKWWLAPDQLLSTLYEEHQMAHARLSCVIMADNVPAILSNSTDVANIIMMIHDRIRYDEKNRRVNNDVSTD